VLLSTTVDYRRRIGVCPGLVLTCAEPIAISEFASRKVRNGKWIETSNNNAASGFLGNGIEKVQS